MKRKLITGLIVIILFCIALSNNIYAYANFEYEDTEVSTDNNNNNLSDITPKIKYLKSQKKKQITIKYDKIPSVEYYHIVISTDKLGRNIYKEYKTTKTSYIIKKLKSKRTYYIKIRGCIGTVYDDDTNEELAKDTTRFSATKKIKVK